MVKSTKCFCRGPRLISYIQIGCLQPPVTLAPGGPASFPGLCGHVLIHVYIYIRTHIYIIKNKS